MIVQPTDIAIFLVSFAACGYCIVLSRRLKALQNTKDGLGATILALSKSVSAVSSAAQDTRAQTGELANRLSLVMKEAEGTLARLSEAKDALEAGRVQHEGEVTAARQELKQNLDEVVRRADDKMIEIATLMKQLKASEPREPRTPRLRPRSADFLFEDDETTPARRKTGS